jgi:hypothetical protein
MTEEEAKSKWCPFVRFAMHEGDGTGAANRADIDMPHWNRCCASDCMAWRWSEPKRTAAFLEAVQKHMQGQDKPNFNTATQAVYAEIGGQFARVEGHCGLAGAA